MTEVRIPISPEQEDVLVDHAMGQCVLGMQPDEREWIRAQVAKKHPGKIIKSADLDIAEGQWVVTVADRLHHT